MRNVWSILTALCVVLATGCGGARHSATAARPGRPFSLTTIGSSYGVQSRLEGFIAVQDDRWVYLVIPRGAVRTYQLDRQDYWDLRVRAGVVACRAREFEVVSEGRAARLAPLLGLSRDAATLDTTTRSLRDTLRLDVGIPAGTDLARSWVALIFEWPFQSVLATYTVHTALPLNRASNPWMGLQAEVAGERCR
jgi:hypothetical protein